MIEINLQLINFSDKYVVWFTNLELLRDFSESPVNISLKKIILVFKMKEN